MSLVNDDFADAIDSERLGIAAIDPIVWLDAYTSEIWPDITAAAAEAVELNVEPLTV